MQVGSLGWEDALKEGMATHSSIPAGNPMDRGAWPATVHRVAKSQTQLQQLGMHVAHVFHNYSTFRLALSTFQLINSQSGKWLDLSDLQHSSHLSFSL